MGIYPCGVIPPGTILLLCGPGSPLAIQGMPRSHAMYGEGGSNAGWIWANTACGVIRSHPSIENATRQRVMKRRRTFRNVLQDKVRALIALAEHLNLVSPQDRHAKGPVEIIMAGEKPQ